MNVNYLSHTQQIPLSTPNALPAPEKVHVVNGLIV